MRSTSPARQYVILRIDSLETLVRSLAIVSFPYPIGSWRQEVSGHWEERFPSQGHTPSDGAVFDLPSGGGSGTASWLRSLGLRTESGPTLNFKIAVTEYSLLHVYTSPVTLMARITSGRKNGTTLGMAGSSSINGEPALGIVRCLSESCGKK